MQNKGTGSLGPSSLTSGELVRAFQDKNEKSRRHDHAIGTYFDTQVVRLASVRRRDLPGIYSYLHGMNTAGLITMLALAGTGTGT